MTRNVRPPDGLTEGPIKRYFVGPMIGVFLNDVPPRQRSAALFDQLRSAILAGRLAAGDRLPTSRELAVELGIARSTIATVYARLVGEGYAEGRIGDGTFVADYHKPKAREATADTCPPAARIARPAPQGEPSLVPPEGGWRADLRTGRPDPGLFPTTEWRRCVTASLGRPPPGYGDYAGLPDLRQAIATWIARSRGVQAAADNVIITAGAQGAFDLCARTLIGQGDVVAVEDPGYEPARLAFAHHGAKLAAVPVDQSGMQVDQIPRHARAIVVTPSHQAPSGSVLSAARRRQLLDLANANDAVVIEDDYDTEYRYVDRPLEPLHLLDARGRVVYVGSFSKTLSPSLRLGFLVAPLALIDELTHARHVVDTQPPHLTQAALATFIGTGAYERHLRRCHRVYRTRREHLIALLHQLVCDRIITAFDQCNAGLHTTVQLPPDTDTERVAQRLRAGGIAVTTTAAARLTDGPIDLVVGFGLADEHRLNVAVDALRAEVDGGPSA
jgi:GntR family transcriptional regulator/MocR family aminotransferase